MDLFVCDGAGKPRGRMDMWAVEDKIRPSYDRRASLVFDNVARVPTDKKQDGHSVSTPHSLMRCVSRQERGVVGVRPHEDVSAAMSLLHASWAPQRERWVL